MRLIFDTELECKKCISEINNRVVNAAVKESVDVGDVVKVAVAELKTKTSFIYGEVMNIYKLEFVVKFDNKKHVVFQMSDIGNRVTITKKVVKE